MKRALITGVLGQDGAHLAELLLRKGYEVHGLVRRSSSSNTWRIDRFKDRLHLHDGDVLDGGCLAEIMSSVQPDEVYNLAAQSHVGTSFAVPSYTGEVTGIGAVKVLEALRQTNCKARFYQASTSEMFGSSPPPQNESTIFHPRSPYGAAKLYAHWMTVNAREARGMFACSGILFNHEGPLRGENFVTRKITLAAARIKKGLQDKLSLGNVDARRDWGYAQDYVEAMWLMLQQERPDDYVIATGETHSVRDFLDAAFSRVDLDWRDHVVVDPKFVRPAEVDDLRGDASKASLVLGWEPKVAFRELVSLMVDADVARVT